MSLHAPKTDVAIPVKIPGPWYPTTAGVNTKSRNYDQPRCHLQFDRVSSVKSSLNAMNLKASPPLLLLWILCSKIVY
jgi:hypothetical protein